MNSTDNTPPFKTLLEEGGTIRKIKYIKFCGIHTFYRQMIHQRITVADKAGIEYEFYTDYLMENCSYVEQEIRKIRDKYNA